MMVRYFELAGVLFRRLDTGFDLFSERLDPDTGTWVDDRSLIHLLAEGASDAVAIDETRAAEIAASHGASLDQLERSVSHGRSGS